MHQGVIVKNLVICCDGTWKRADQPYVSNIEKIARAVDSTPSAGLTQIVYYSSGVGTGATKMEHLLGGALGLGLDEAIVSAYRFLALNYEPGDQVFVFGFSRGAYTARSLVGMVDSIGLLTPDGVVGNYLCQAISVYRNRPRDGAPPLAPETAEALEGFKDNCYPSDQVRIRFLGVFDTVGALGVPGFSSGKYQFHDVELSQRIDVARQALAIDERRTTFAPCIWSTSDNERTDVKQVWFEGVHTDIGGGYPESAPSDITLNWMIDEATNCGLKFHEDRVLCNQNHDPLTPHNSLTTAYRFINALKGISKVFGGYLGGERFDGSRRILELDKDESIKLSAIGFDRWHGDTDNRRRTAPNVGWWVKDIKDRNIASRLEKVALPAPDQCALAVANLEKARLELLGQRV